MWRLSFEEEIMRSGVIAKKIGMTRIFREDGRQVPVTVLKLEKLQVVAQRTLEKDGYCALKLGAGTVKAKNCNKALRGQFSIANVEPKKRLKEFRVSSDNLIDVGQEIGVGHYVEGQYVDVSGMSIGKGFAGAMKRHNFSGLRASHGVSVSHRSHGSTGQCQDPGRVFKGKKMAGHLGDASVTIQNLQVVRTDPDKGLIMIKGAVPGAKGGWVTLKDAVKKKAIVGVPYPTAKISEPKAEIEMKSGEIGDDTQKLDNVEKSENKPITEGKNEADLEIKDES